MIAAMCNIDPPLHTIYMYKIMMQPTIICLVPSLIPRHSDRLRTRLHVQQISHALDRFCDA